MQHLLALISMHSLHYKEYLWMISASIVRVHRSSNSKLLNYDLIHEKYIQFPFLHAVLCSVLSMI